MSLATFGLPFKKYQLFEAGQVNFSVFLALIKSCGWVGVAVILQGMTDCVFCRIVAGEIPAYKVYEDDEYLGFLDINPYSVGQVDVIPKKHYRWVDDVPDFLGYFARAKLVSQALREALGPWAVFYIVQGLGMPHAHIKISPLGKDDKNGEKMKQLGMPKDEIMKDVAKKVSEAAKRLEKAGLLDELFGSGCACGGNCECEHAGKHEKKTIKVGGGVRS